MEEIIQCDILCDVFFIVVQMYFDVSVGFCVFQVFGMNIYYVICFWGIIVVFYCLCVVVYLIQFFINIIYQIKY